MHRVVIIGGGISGLASAYLIQRKALQAKMDVQVVLLEKEPRVGGKVWSKQADGYLCEWGPNGFLNNKPQTLELCRLLNIENRLLASDANARVRFVYANGSLHKLPHNLKEFIFCGLLSWRAKLRLIAELFVASRTLLDDESLADFARRRLGDEALAKLITPMAAGIFAGNPDNMSLAACFPRIRQLERQYGSLIKAMLCLAWKKSNGGGQAGPAGPGGVLSSFHGGLQVLTDRLREAIGQASLILSAEVKHVSHAADGSFKVVTQDGAIIADSLICAAPAYAASSIFADLDPGLAASLAKIEYSPLIVVCLGYAAKDINFNLNGFGYLFARGEKIPILGTLWDSSIFVDRVPEGKVLFRSMLGGAKSPELIRLTDEEIQQLVSASLQQILGISAQPEMVQIFRHQQAIPQYQLGHLELLAQIGQQINKYPGLYLGGNAYRGIGINDCVASAYSISQDLIAQLLSKSAPANR